MQSTLIALAMPFLLATAAASQGDSVVAYRCDELVVRGRVTTVGHAEIEGAASRGMYSMKVKIKRVLRGTEPRKTVLATGIAHGQMREDADLWLVLTPANNGGYTVRTGNLWGPPPKLATACEDVRHGS